MIFLEKQTKLELSISLATIEFGFVIIAIKLFI